jgi:tetratricopeptide (TPR) repeat protein
VADLAKLVVQVDSRGVARARNELGQYTKQADKADTATDNFKSTWSSFGKLLLAGGIAIGFRQIVKAVDDGERALAQLEAGLRSTNNVSGQTVDGLVALSEEMQRTTRFADDVVQSAEAILLSFTNIADDAFPRTVRAAADVATRMGTDLRSAIVQLGKALNDPVQNLGALSRSGIQFSKSQKIVIKEMWETNRVAEAQRIILDELERQYGGSAQAARETLGGALTNLKNSFSDLAEAIGGAGSGSMQYVFDQMAIVLDVSSKAIKEITRETRLMLGITDEATAKVRSLTEAEHQYAMMLHFRAEAEQRTGDLRKWKLNLEFQQEEMAAKILKSMADRNRALMLGEEAEARFQMRLALGSDELGDRVVALIRERKELENKQAIEEYIEALRREADTVHLSAEARAFHTAILRGATEEQAEEVQRLTAIINKYGELGTQIDKTREAYTSLSVDANQAFEDMRAGLPTLGAELQNLSTNFTQSFVSSLFDAEQRAEMTFESIASDFAEMVAQMLAQQALLSLIGLPTGQATIFTSDLGSASAKGNAFSGGRVVPMARGGVVTQPTLFPMQRGAGLMGEAGPEAVMPLSRTSSGELGVKAEGVGGEVVVNVINNTGAPVTQNRRQSGQRTEVDVVIGAAVNKQLMEGAFDSAMRDSYDLRRRGQRR